MSTRSASEIAIHHLNVKGRSDEVKAVVHDFETSSWPEAPAQEWVFIRNLAVKAKKTELRLHTAQAMDSARRQAVAGGGSDANQANAVRFANLSEMLAFLLRDLVHGDAVFRWYWQRWSALLREPKSQAIAQLLWEDAEALPAVVEQLVKIRQLEAVWLALQPQAAELIADKLLSTFTPLTSPSGEITEDNASTIPPAIFQAMQRIPVTLRTWAPVFRRLSMADPRVRLAACLAGLQHFPLLLLQHPQALSQVFYRSVLSTQLLAAFDSPITESMSISASTNAAKRVSKKASSEKAKRDEQAAASTDIAANNHMEQESRQAIDAFLQRQQRASDSEPAATLSQRLSNATPVSDRPELQTPSGKHEETTVAPPEQALPAFETSESSQPLSGNEFHTHLGGTFYLINVLTPFVDELIQTTSALDYGAGFRWLFEVLRRFEPEVDDPLLHFFARQCELDNVAELLALPVIPEFDAIHSALEQRYPEIWNQELLQVPASVIYSASHIDCFLPLNAVRLPVRLQGLDVNPGWVPWLGRVVQLHYCESLGEH